MMEEQLTSAMVDIHLTKDQVKITKLDIIIEIIFKSFLYEFVWKWIIFMINRLFITIC